MLSALGSKYEVAKTDFLLAQLALENGSQQQVQNHLAAAMVVFEDLGAQFDLTEAEVLKRRLSPQA